MPTFVEIDGAQVDMDDACAVVKALRAVELKIVSGGGMIAVRMGRDNEVRWDRSNLARLGDLILRYESVCDRQQGKRARFAKRMRFMR